MTETGVLISTDLLADGESSTKLTLSQPTHIFGSCIQEHFQPTSKCDPCT